MITFDFINTVDDKIFNSMFAHSYDFMERDTMPWFMFPRLTTYEDKRIFGRHFIDTFLANHRVVQISVDGYPVVLMCVEDNGDGSANVPFGVTRPDSSGSKSYFYSPEFMQTRDSFCESNNIAEWTITAYKTDNSIVQHFYKLEAAGALGTNIEEIPEELIPGYFKVEMRFYK